MPHDESCQCNGGQCDCKEGACECNCDCECCGGGAHFHRRFQTKEEQIAELEAYRGELSLELKAVEERLTDLRK